MSIEEKAKAYDEALEKARIYRDNAKAVEEYSAVTRYENIFPELHEPEEERTRKALIQFLNDIKSISESDRTSWAVRKEDAEMCNNFITYLEKKKEIDSTPLDWNDYKDKPVEVWNAYLRGKAVGIEIEKQKKQKSTSFNEPYNPHDYEAVMEGNATSLKRKEQKPAEWSYPYGKNETVDRLVSIAECLEMNGDCVYNGYNGNECGVFLRALAREYLCIEELVNVVQDKNLMDILYYASSDDHFPSLRKLHTLLTSYNEQKEQKPNYCHYGGDPNIERCKHCSATCIGRLVEEQKPKKRPKFKIGDVVKFKGFGDEPADDTPLKIVGYDNELYLFDNGTTDLFSEQNLYELVEQKPTDYCSVRDEFDLDGNLKQTPVEWSEDDEQFLLICKNALYKYQRTDQWDANIISKWLEERLKSLRPVKQELSEEDETIIEGACNALEIHGHTKLAKRLKSLRPQPQGIYQQVVKGLRDMCDRYEQNGIFADERARDFLANVRIKCKDAIECAPILDESSWKPSKEQMKALGASIVFHKNDPNVDLLRSLYDDLQKIR